DPPILPGPKEARERSGDRLRDADLEAADFRIPIAKPLLPLVFDGDHLAPPVGQAMLALQVRRDLPVLKRRRAGAVQDREPLGPGPPGLGTNGFVGHSKLGRVFSLRHGEEPPWTPAS